jgi:hypothetical protein
MKYCDAKSHHVEALGRLKAKQSGHRAGQAQAAAATPSQPRNARLNEEELANLNVLFLVLIYLCSQQGQGQARSLQKYEKQLMEYMINDPSQPLQEKRDKTEIGATDSGTAGQEQEYVFQNEDAVERLVSRADHTAGARRSLARTRMLCRQIDIVSKLCSREFKLELTGVITLYELYRGCAHGHAARYDGHGHMHTTGPDGAHCPHSSVFVMIYQLLFLKDSTSLRREFTPLLEKAPAEPGEVPKYLHAPQLIA